jgi:putative serine/threonine protein kinase
MYVLLTFYLADACGKLLKAQSVVFTENLTQMPYGSVLCYPNVDEAELKSRIAELTSLNVEAVEFSGGASVFNVPVVGKGYVGVVVIARLNGQRVALKIRRIDADRENLLHEAQMLVKANSVEVGPLFIGVSNNFLLMKLIDGDLIPHWLEKVMEVQTLRTVLRDILEQCWRIDTVGLDHGELSNAPKHLIVDASEKPWIVDFETASDKRKPANLPAMCHFLFTSPGETARVIVGILGERKREEIVGALQSYKKDKNRETFDMVAEVCLGA